MPSTSPTTVATSLSGADYDATTLSKEDEWMAKLDHAAFKEDVRALGKVLQDQQGPEDIAHLRKIIRWQRLCVWVGALTMWYCVNPISIYLMSIGTMAKWAIVAHHTCHGGFDRCSKGEFNRFKYGVGSMYRRCADWLDWMLVEAWNVEHNQMHHYCLGEILDPDLVEHNFTTLRNAPLPDFVKRAVVFLAMGVWKWYYYAPNTFKQLKIHELRRAGKVPTYRDGTPVSQKDLDSPCPVSLEWFYGKEGAIFFTLREFFVRVLGPYFTRQFVLLPAIAYLLVGQTAAVNSLISLVLAELLTNYHSFLVIVTNHAGDDLYRFQRHCNARSATFYMRQVTSSVNFRTGNGSERGGACHGFLADLNDFHHGWLNFQIEHHVWPDLSMLSYQKGAPLLRAICEKHNVPYVQQSVWWRLHKTVQIIIGAESMRKYPNKYEKEEDLVAEVEKEAHEAHSHHH